MRTTKLAVATILAAAALAVGAQPRTEAGPGPFTYEALGATPSLRLGRAAAPKAAQAPKPADATAKAAARTPASTAAAGAFTYEALGGTPHVEVRRAARTDVATPPAAH